MLSAAVGLEGEVEADFALRLLRVSCLTMVPFMNGMFAGLLKLVERRMKNCEVQC